MWSRQTPKYLEETRVKGPFLKGSGHMVDFYEAKANDMWDKSARMRKILNPCDFSQLFEPSMCPD
jgi:hypothetical protein